MSKVQCFKIKNGTNYDKAVKQHFKLLRQFNGMYEKISEILGENITRMAQTKDYLIIDLNELTKEENKRVFKKDGTLKLNTKKGKDIANKFEEAIKELGLENFEELRKINFIYGVMRRSQSQELSSFVTSEDDIYYKANFDLDKVSEGCVEPITEIEFEEKYLDELKKRG